MAQALKLSPGAEALLNKLLSNGKTPQKLARRAQIILDSHLGVSPTRIAEFVGKDRTTVYRWRSRWRQRVQGFLEAEEADADEEVLAEKLGEILSDAPRSGAPPLIHRRADHPDRGAGLRTARRLGAPHQPLDDT